MIAPTTLAVAATFSAEKMYGSDAGTRSFQSIVQRPAAYERISSSARGVGRLQAAQRVDRDGEERQVGGDHRDRRPSPRRGRQLRVHPDDDHRRDREDRDRLRRDDVRQEAALQRSASATSTTPSAKPNDRAEREADRGLLRGEERRVQEHVDQGGAVDLRGCSKSACTIVQTCGIVVSSTTNGHVQPVAIQIQR